MLAHGCQWGFGGFRWGGHGGFCCVFHWGWAVVVLVVAVVVLGAVVVVNGSCGRGVTVWWGAACLSCVRRCGGARGVQKDTSVTQRGGGSSAEGEGVKVSG